MPPIVVNRSRHGQFSLDFKVEGSLSQLDGSCEEQDQIPRIARMNDYLRVIQPCLPIFSDSHHVPIFVAFPAIPFLENKPSHLCLSESYEDVFSPPHECSPTN
jgi:hypothetical protein